jgi:zinc finger protein ZPR1
VEELIDTYFDPATEVVELPGVCPDCNSDEDKTRSLMVDIPFFKDVLIMSYTCAKCGYRSNEVKAGGAIPIEGQRITLREVTKEDFTRDVLKAETAAVIIPELRLEVTEGSLGGKFTTVEGLLSDIYKSFADNPFVTGDSADTEAKSNMSRFVDGLGEVRCWCAFVACGSMERVFCFVWWLSSLALSHVVLSVCLFVVVVVVVH